MESFRLAALLTGLSMVADIGMGLEPGEAGRAALVAMELADAAGAESSADVYYTSLLQHVGCTGYAHEGVVSNLLSNAIRYSPRGGKVTVTARESARSTIVSVTDEGIGIPADQRQQIFHKFFRVDNSDTRQIGGTGLGLALTRELVHAHGGEIGFDTLEGRGSTFWFTVPNS